MKQILVTHDPAQAERGCNQTMQAASSQHKRHLLIVSK
jgi:hypothetical protein